MGVRDTAAPIRLAQAAALALALAAPPAGVSGQAFHGRVLDAETDEGVSTALVRLLDGESRDVAVTLADSLGRYRLEAPGPGTYRLAAEGLGYAAAETPLLRVEDADRDYAVDLTTRRVPIPIRGMEVSVERQRELERAINLVVGTNPRSLRTPPIPRRVIEDHLDKGHSFPDLVRWTNAPIVVKGFGRDLCFEYRLVCMRVFLNGVPLGPHFWDTLPLDMVETIVIVGSNESIVYGPSILLYTAGRLR
ncbi:MAG: hypothetical protein AMXMBFR53_24370 [Gemmatimonadota bacterium]